MARLLLAWGLMVGGLAGWWCCRPWLEPTTFNWGQVVVLMLSWKVASLLVLSPPAWRRFTPLRFLAYCCWPGMQPSHFLVGQTTTTNAPVPTVAGLLLNAATGAVLLLVVPRFLPDSTPVAIRFWIAFTGLCLLALFVRLDLWALVFRAMGFAVEKFWDCPVAATTVGEFWGQRWNRLVSGLLREVIFLPLARRVGARLALFGVFLYSGFYHEAVSFLVDAGYGGPMLYFLIQYAGVAIETVRPVRRALQARPWVGWVWTFAVVVLPLGLFLHPKLINDFLMPELVKAGVPGLGVDRVPD